MAKLTRAQVSLTIGFAKAFTRNRTEYHLLVLKDGRPALGWSDDRFCGEQEAYYDAFDKASALLNEGREDDEVSQEEECNAKVDEAKKGYFVDEETFVSSDGVVTTQKDELLFHISETIQKLANEIHKELNNDR